MPVYAYKGVTAGGKPTRGSVTADSLRAARGRMRQDGIFLTEIDEAQQAPETDSEDSTLRRISLRWLQHIPVMERAIATRQLATLVGAGIPLVEALGALVAQVEHGRLKAALGRVRQRVNEGSSLADALTQTGQFDSLYISMIRAGEAGGALETVLARIADYLEDQVRLRNKVSSILVYPLVMLGFAGFVVAALVTVVLPQITELLVSLDQPLPFYTRWIIGSAEFARTWWWAGLLIFALAFVGLRAAIQTERGRSIYDRARLRAPVLGRITRVLAIARFTRTLATLLGSGVGIVSSLEISRHVANNWVIGQAIDEAKISIVEGSSLAAPLRASGEFPPLVTTMVEVGERSGELESMLNRVAATYDEQVETSVSRITSLLEPALILVMVAIVLVIILATLMPLLQITGSLA